MALIITAAPGPSPFMNACACSSVVLPSVPAGTGMPSDFASSRALPLSPKSSRCSARGPMKVSRFSSQSRAKPAFSLRKPYPGCTASQPLSRATAIIRSMSR